LSKRGSLIRRTLLLCSLPVLLVAAFIAIRQWTSDDRYVAGQEQEGITRSLDRSLEPTSIGLRFTEVSEQAGIRFEHFPFQRTSQLPEDMGPGGAWGDYDGDGLPDLFLVNFAAPLGVSDAEMAGSPATDRLFRNRGDGTFEDVTEAAGVGAAHRGIGASFGDYDADGDDDLFVTSWGRNILWDNQGDGTFLDVTARAGLTAEGFWAGASWADFDLDGDLDLYVCGYVYYIPEPPGTDATRVGDAENPFTINPSSYAPRPNLLYVNRGDGSFEERAAAAGVQSEMGRSLAAAWADFDGDGLPDLYVANDVSDNGMYRNRGDGTFQDVSYESLVADYRSSMGIGVGDWDGNLELDLFLTHWVAQENALFSNRTTESQADGSEGGLRFRDDADRVGLGQIALDLVGWGTAFVDFDNDGWLDLFVANGSTLQQRDHPSQLVPMHPHLYWNKGPDEGFFEVGAEAGFRTKVPGVGRGAAFADYDADGDADLLIVRHGGRARLLRNDSPGGNWVAFRVRAQSGHPSGIGARIVVRVGDRAYLREAGAGPSYLSHNFSDVLFGLGEAARVDRVEVSWPGGHQEVWSDLEVDRLWHLEEGRPPRPVDSPAAMGSGSDEAAAMGVERDQPARRHSGVSKHALVSDVSSDLTREEKQRFWQLNRRAQDLFVKGSWEAAAAVFAEMTALDPQHEDALYYRGNSLLELERFAEAGACWEQLVRLNASSSRAWVQLGILHTLTASGAPFDLNAASNAFETAHRINREESRPPMLWGEVDVAQGRLDAAHENLEAAYRMNPRATTALYLSGYIAWKRGDAPRAQELLERASASFEKEVAVRGVLGEGDTRSDEMNVMRRRAARRRLFAGCIEALRSAPEPLDPEQIFPCVDKTRAGLFAPSRSNAHAAPLRRSLQPILACPRSIA
jgi:tetratricopeptide (TPR) repeat protein